MNGIEEAVQKAVFAKLNASSELDGMLARHNKFNRGAIYDYMPQPADSGTDNLFPMITIGEDRPLDWSTDTASGAEVAVVIHIWSRERTWIEAKRIAGAIYRALNRQELAVPDYEFISCDFDSSEQIRDPDGLTLHIVAQYNMIIDETGYGE